MKRGNGELVRGRRRHQRRGIAVERGRRPTGRAARTPWSAAAATTTLARTSRRSEAEPATRRQGEATVIRRRFLQPASGSTPPSAAARATRRVPIRRDRRRRRQQRKRPTTRTIAVRAGQFCAIQFRRRRRRCNNSAGGLGRRRGRTPTTRAGATRDRRRANNHASGDSSVGRRRQANTAGGFSPRGGRRFEHGGATDSFAAGAVRRRTTTAPSCGVTQVRHQPLLGGPISSSPAPRAIFLRTNSSLTEQGASSTPRPGRTSPSGGRGRTASDRTKKHDFQSLDKRSVLEKVARMPITSWSYKAEKPAIRHIGPMAQDFYKALGSGSTTSTSPRSMRAGSPWRRSRACTGENQALAENSQAYGRTSSNERRSIEPLDCSSRDLRALDKRRGSTL